MDIQTSQLSVHNDHVNNVTNDEMFMFTSESHVKFTQNNTSSFGVGVSECFSSIRQTYPKNIFLTAVVHIFR